MTNPEYCILVIRCLEQFNKTLVDKGIVQHITIMANLDSLHDEVIAHHMNMAITSTDSVNQIGYLMDIREDYVGRIQEIVGITNQIPQQSPNSIEALQKELDVTVLGQRMCEDQASMLYRNGHIFDNQSMTRFFSMAFELERLDENLEKYRINSENQFALKLKRESLEAFLSFRNSRA